MNEPAPYRVEALATAHDRASFTCGVASLDAYLKRQASQDVRRRVAYCYVLTPDGTTIAGYYTLSAASLARATLPQAAQKDAGPYHTVPAALIGRLAVSTAYRGQGLGEALLLSAFARILRSELAVNLILVDALPHAIGFYVQYGFQHLPAKLSADTSMMFLPVANARQVLTP
jgi:predicted GNAT family N-acyltransferase